MTSIDWQRVLLDKESLAFLWEVAGRTLLAYAVVFVFLLLQGLDGFHADQQYYEPSASGFLGYVAKLLFGTALAALRTMDLRGVAPEPTVRSAADTSERPWSVSRSRAADSTASSNPIGP